MDTRHPPLPSSPVTPLFGLPLRYPTKPVTRPLSSHCTHGFTRHAPRCGQVFPVEYHVSTLQLLLDHLGWLCASTNVKALLVGMMDRLNQAAVVEEEKGGEEAATGVGRVRRVDAPPAGAPRARLCTCMSSFSLWKYS